MLTFTPSAYPGFDATAFIPSSADVAGIELRMLPPLIRDNRTIRFWPFPGRAKLYYLTLVISDAANQLSGQLDLNAFPRIGRMETLPIHKTIYYWEDNPSRNDDKAPTQLHLFTSIIKSKGTLRDVGEVMESARNDQDYQDLVDRLSSLITDTASYAAAAQLTLQIAHVVGRYLGKVEDAPIATIIRSFTRLHGDWDHTGIIPISIPTPCVDFGFELIVRDKREFSPVVAQETLELRPAELADMRQMVRL